MKKIVEVENQIASAIQALRKAKDENLLPVAFEPLLQLVPSGGVKVEVCLKNGDRDIRSDAPENSWAPDERHSVKINYLAQDVKFPDAVTLNDEEKELIRLVADAERDPKRNFLGLKMLRDKLLLESGLSCFSTEDLRRLVVDHAILRGLLKTGKVQNPNKPEFPVTSIALNREHPDVIKYLQDKDKSHRDFAAPFRMSGKPLSETIRESRR